MTWIREGVDESVTSTGTPLFANVSKTVFLCARKLSLSQSLKMFLSLLAKIHLFKVNNRNFGKMCEICSKLNKNYIIDVM